MAIIELVDRDTQAKKVDVKKKITEPTKANEEIASKEPEKKPKTKK